MKTSAKLQGLWLCLAPEFIVRDTELPIPANDSSILGDLAGKPQEKENEPPTAA